MDRYKALALQVVCEAVNRVKTKEAAEAVMLKTIERLDAQIRASKAFIGRDTKLVVLPEYFLTGFPMGESIPAWKDKACLEIDGKIYEALGKIAQKHQVFLSGNAYELDEHFPNLYFQTSFVIDDTGEAILRYRRLNSMFAPTPHDVWDKYLEIYGYESLFPVTKTEIGNLACIASEEILYPEVARCLMMRGAEIFLHSTSEVGSPQLTRKNIAKAARAIENMTYVVSANSAGIANIDIPINSTDGSSKILDYNGLILAEANTGESMVANATIDLAALRAHRKRPAMSNYIARQRFEIYAPSYTNHHFYPSNSISENPAFVKQDFVKNQLETIEKLGTDGVI
ncbi:MAG: nitrilase-related carbon-nitrogen hydrolase [Bacteroidota bacterium]